MFEQLNLLWVYPVYNATLSCLGVVIISGIKDKKVDRLRVGIVGICTLTVGVIVLYTHYNSEQLMYIYERLIATLPISISILCERDKVTILSFDDQSRSAPSSSAPSSSAPSSSAPSSSAPYAGKPAPKQLWDFNTSVISPTGLTEDRLNELYTKPNKPSLRTALNKLNAQVRETGYKRPKSIYSAFSKEATLNTFEQNAVARQLMGQRKGYVAYYDEKSGTTLVMQQKAKAYEAITANKNVINDLTEGTW